MAASLEVLGIEDHTWLGLSDSRLPYVDPELGVELVAHVIDRVRPDAVLTFGPDGMTGHPDHVAIGDWAARAVTSGVGDRCVVLAATKTKTWSDTFRDMNQEVFETGPPCTPDVDLALEVRLHDKLSIRRCGPWPPSRARPPDHRRWEALPRLGRYRVLGGPDHISPR